jgi:hypothetical protein
MGLLQKLKNFVGRNDILKFQRDGEAQEQRHQKDHS